MGWREQVGDGRFATARRLEGQGQDEAARLIYRDIRRDDPRNVAAFLAELRLTRDPAEREALRRTLRSTASEAAAAGEASWQASLVALEAHLLDDELAADRSYLRALELDDTNPLAHALYAEALEARADQGGALTHWRAAVRSESPPPFALRRLAHALVASHEYDEAIGALSDLVELEPGDAVALFNLGTLLLDVKKDAAGACEYLERAHELNDGDLDIIMNLASAALLNGREDRALELMQRAERLAPDEPEVQFNLAVFHADHRHDPERAVKHFRRYLELGGEDVMRVNKWIEKLTAGEDG